jgi:hypothetical protein
LPIGPSKNYLRYGFLYLIKERNYKMALVHFVLTILSGGLFWFAFAKGANKENIIKRLNRGYSPASSQDSYILKIHDLRPAKLDDGYIGISRLGSCDGVIYSHATHVQGSRIVQSNT